MPIRVDGASFCAYYLHAVFAPRLPQSSDTPGRAQPFDIHTEPHSTEAGTGPSRPELGAASLSQPSLPAPDPGTG